MEKQDINKDSRPNVLAICVDHWPGRFLGVAGKSDLKTPTLNEMAKKGIMFDNCYSECPVCIPARRTIMTGLSPESHGDRIYSPRMEMPSVKTLADVFTENGYQTIAVGKLHVYPPRDRIGFGDVILTEEGRYEFGGTDDYEVWLGENGHLGEEFAHGLGNNTYYTRPWHLEEKFHPTSFVTREMIKQIRRKDPTKPAFFYCSYQFPHPPLVPVQAYWDMYKDKALESTLTDNWEESDVIQRMRCLVEEYTPEERLDARRAFYAQCTYIDMNIRMLIGTLHECGLLKNTIITFMSDHGDMLFDHQLLAKRCFYENSTNVPMIMYGNPVLKYKDCVDSHKLMCLADYMPTLLDMCGISSPECDGISMVSENSRDYIFGEIGEDNLATRMIRSNGYKLIYYPYGNVYQLFDMHNDRKEEFDLSRSEDHKTIFEELKQLLIENLYGSDLKWIKDGCLVGDDFACEENRIDFTLHNQRSGYHWPVTNRKV